MNEPQGINVVIVRAGAERMRGGTLAVALPLLCSVVRFHLPAAFWRSRAKAAVATLGRTATGTTGATCTRAHRATRATKATAARSAAIAVAGAAAAITAVAAAAIAITAAIAVAGATTGCTLARATSVATTGATTAVTTATGAATAFQLGRGWHLAAQCSAAREVNTSLLIDFDHHDGDFVTNGDDILRTISLVVGQLRGAHQALFAGQDFHERAEIDEPAHGAGVDAPDLNLLG